MALPFHQGVANITTGLWQTLASLASVSKKAKRKYFVPTKDHEYLYTHPAPNSLVVESVHHRERNGQPAHTPKDKDARRLDTFGKKVYSSASFQLQVANHQALLSWYEFNLWGSLSKFEPLLWDKDGKKLRALIDEASDPSGFGCSSRSRSYDGFRSLHATGVMALALRIVGRVPIYNAGPAV